MEYTLTDNKDTTATININYSKEELDEAFEKAYIAAKDKVKVNGFRPGKAPLNMVKKILGESVATDAINILVKNSLLELLPKLEPTAIEFPKVSIDKYERNEGVSIKAVYETNPIVELGQYKGLKWNSYNFIITEEDIDKEIEAIRNELSTQKLLEPDEKLEKGNIVSIEFKLFPMDADLGDETTRENSKLQAFTLVVGDERNLHGFNENIEGSIVGETKSFISKYPENLKKEGEDNPIEEFQVELTIKEAYKIILPEINDDLANEWNETPTMVELREQIRKNLATYYENQINDSIYDDKLEEIRNNSNTIIPNVMILEEKENLYKQILKNNKIKYLPQEEFYKKYNINKEEFEENLRKQADLRLKNTYIIYNIAIKENLYASEDELNEYINNLQEDEETKNKILKDNEQRVLLKNKLTFERVYNFILENSERVDSGDMTKEKFVEFFKKNAANEESK